MRTRTNFTFLVLAVIFAAMLCGCSNAAVRGAEQKADLYFYDETTGTVYSDYSQSFDIKIEQWKYYYDTAASQDRILLSLTIKNKTEKKLDGFNAVISLNQDAADLVASGILVYDQFEPCDLIPEKSANGASYAIDFLVEHDAWLTETHTDKSALLDDIRLVTLDLSWDCGKETIELQLDPLAIS
jgi:hypothetical protein